MVTTILTTTELEIEAPAAVGHVPTLCVFLLEIQSTKIGSTYKGSSISLKRLAFFYMTKSVKAIHKMSG